MAFAFNTLRRASRILKAGETDLDTVREAKRWTEALEICKKQRADPSIESVIRGEQSFYDNDLDAARERWKSVIDNPNARYVALVQF